MKVLIAGALAPMMLAIAQTGSRTVLVGLAIMLFLVFLRVRYIMPLRVRAHERHGGKDLILRIVRRLRRQSR